MRPPPLAWGAAGKLLPSLCLGAGLAVGAPGAADSDVYKCEGPATTEYSDSPCPGGWRIELDVPRPDRSDAPEAGLRPGEVEMLERSAERAEIRQARREERERARREAQEHARREAMLRAWLEREHADHLWAGTLLHRGHPHPPFLGHHRPHHPGADRHHRPGRGPLRGRSRHGDHLRHHDEEREPRQELRFNRR